MSVHLVPDKILHFHGPFIQPTTTTLTITNENATPVAFKIKTTAVKLFIVRPNSGRIEPGDSIDLTITFSIMRDQNPFARRGDKFLVQSTVIRSEDTMDLQYVWNDAADDTRTIYVQKLSAKYLPQLEGAESTGPDEMSDPIAVSTESTRLPFAPSTEAPPLSLWSDSSNRDESRNEYRQPPGSSTVHVDLGRPLPPIPDLTAHDKRVLEQQLNDAQEEIRYLRALLVRSGDGANSATDADAPTRTPAPKSLASGVESMMAALRNYVHPLASSGLLDADHS